MLYLHTSHRLEQLLEGLLDLWAAQPLPPFSADLVVVQSKGMGRWISLRAAERLGVCAHTRFPLPASFLWELLCQTLGELPRRSAFSPEVLSWRLLDWLDSQPLSAAPARLAAYLRDDDALRRFQLAERIADVFDQYLVYRPDWIAAWENGELRGLGVDEAWQADLWRFLVAERNQQHRAHWLEQLLARLNSAEMPLNLPPRLAVFGVSSLPPMFLQVLEALAQRSDIHIFALNPCREFWGEIRDFREISRLAGDQSADDLYLEVGHPLLAAFGKQGREFFDSLAACQAVESSLPESDAPPHTLLEHLQADIVALCDRRLTDKPPLAVDDDSIQIHVCHSPLREVEVLHDGLLNLLNRHPDLTPGDIAVLTPDIGVYAPYIEAVFAARPGQPSIPYAIADRSVSSEQPLLETFLSLLELPESRLAADAVLSWLEQPALRRRFELESDDLDLIRPWLRRSGVCWGRDAAHKHALGLPASPRHTWREGLNRLLIGYALPNRLAEDSTALYADLLPLDDAEGSRADVLGRFAEFVESLFELADALAQTHDLAAWAATLRTLLQRLFEASDDDEAAALQRAHSALALLEELGALAEFNRPVELAVVQAWLCAQLRQADGSSGFLSGGVTFCTLVPMRNLPFRVLCVLGLNHDTFPRRQRPSGFDLMALRPRRGDRSRRADDRYLFLETLMSARQVLYLSYVGRDVRDNGERPPSVLLETLLDVIRQNYGAHWPLVWQHALQPFSADYFNAATRWPSYSNTWANAARCAGSGSTDSRVLFSAALPEAEDEWRSVELADLCYFLRNPARYLLEKRLDLRLERAEDELPAREPFELNYLAALDVRQQVVRCRLAQHDTATVAPWADASGHLPHGAVGRVLFDRQAQRAQQQATQLLPHWPSHWLEPAPVYFEAAGLSLSGWLHHLTPAGLLVWTVDKASAARRLDLWLQHLLLCLQTPDGVVPCSRLWASDGVWCFERVPVTDAERYLTQWLAGYWRGLHAPLPFFVKSSWVYAEKTVQPSNRKDGASARESARSESRKIWQGSEFGPAHPESANPYYQAVYRDIDPLNLSFETLALEYLEPALMYGRWENVL